VNYEVEGLRPKGRPEKTWCEVVEKDCGAHQLNKEDAVDHSSGRKLNVLCNTHPDREWASERSLLPGHPGCPG